MKTLKVIATIIAIALFSAFGTTTTYAQTAKTASYKPVTKPKQPVEFSIEGQWQSNDSRLVINIKRSNNSISVTNRAGGTQTFHKVKANIYWGSFVVNKRHNATKKVVPTKFIEGYTFITPTRLRLVTVKENGAKQISFFTKAPPVRQRSSRR